MAFNLSYGSSMALCRKLCRILSALSALCRILSESYAGFALCTSRCRLQLRACRILSESYAGFALCTSRCRLQQRTCSSRSAPQPACSLSFLQPKSAHARIKSGLVILLSHLPILPPLMTSQLQLRLTFCFSAAAALAAASLPHLPTPAAASASSCALQQLHSPTAASSCSCIRQ